MTPVSIEDSRVYLTRMNKAMEDKLWFLDFGAKPSTVIDFGCADGAMLEFLRRVYGDTVTYIGVENNEEFAAKAREKGFNVVGALAEIERTPNTLIVLSSVLHELYAYSDPTGFYRELARLHPRYIAVRDMAPSDNKTSIAHEEELPATAWAQFKELYSWDLNLVHFLIKYPYTENWNRELRENYRVNWLTDLRDNITSIVGANYGWYQREQLLPYWLDKWTIDFGAQFVEDNRLKEAITHRYIFVERPKEDGE